MEFWGSQKEPIGDITKKKSVDKWWYKNIVSSDLELHKIISNGMIQQWEFNEWVEAAEKIYISTEWVEDIPKTVSKSTLS